MSTTMLSRRTLAVFALLLFAACHEDPALPPPKATPLPMPDLAMPPSDFAIPIDLMPPLPTFEPVPVPTIAGNWTLSGVAFPSTTTGWACGSTSSAGVLLQYSNGAWSSVTPPAVSGMWQLNSISFISESEGWATGSTMSGQDVFGVLLHYSGGQWTSVALPSPPGSVYWYLNSVSMASSGEGWAVGVDLTNDQSLHERGAVLHSTGGVWSVDTTVDEDYDDINRVQAISATEAWAVGSGPNQILTGGGLGGVIWHYTQGAWTQLGGIDRDIAWGLTRVAFSSPSSGWAVGFTGSLFSYGASGWTDESSMVPRGLGFGGFALVGPSEFWTVGNVGSGNNGGHGVSAHFDGTSWIVQDLAQLYPGVNSWSLSDVAFPAPDEGWAVGNNSDSGTGIILHYHP